MIILSEYIPEETVIKKKNFEGNIRYQMQLQNFSKNF
jgi:hypothetical protein